MTRRYDIDSDWTDLAEQWDIRPGTTYLNHGSFGPSPRVVRNAKRQWTERLDSQPMDFYVRQLEPALDAARASVANFVGTTAERMVLVENATYGMNVVAGSFPLRPGDEVLLNDHEYGAVFRIWNRVANQTGAVVKSVTMPDRFESVDPVREAIVKGITPNTKLVILSHVTSPTALILPLEQIIPAIRDRGVAVCVDGPHAPAHIPLDIDSLDCDFYTASCHKWLCGPLGTGFLFVHPRQQQNMQPLMKSWGRLLPAVPARWDEEFTWSGTRDPAGYLALPAAIDFMKQVGLDAFRKRVGWLAGEAERRLVEMFGTEPTGSRAAGWYGAMAHVPLPPGEWPRLQDRLWHEFGIETPVIQFGNRWYIRVSAHLYTTLVHLDHLMKSLSICIYGK